MPDPVGTVDGLAASDPGRWRSKGPRLASTWTDVGGRRVHARVAAADQPDAPTVVLVHGLISSRYLVPTAERLAGPHNVFAPDLPGFGASPRSRSALDVRGLTDALAAHLEAVGIEAAVVVGHSVGTQVVSDLAVRHPQLVGRIVLAAPTFEPGARSIVRLYGRWLRNAVREPLSLNGVLVREVLDFGVVRPVRVLLSALRDPVERRLPRVAVPALVVRGERDTVATQQWCQRVAGLLPDARMVVVPGAPHTVTYSAPSQLAGVLAGFAAGGDG